ncbi:AAA-domain-containing protein [Cristinia sonorae]|uniref:Peroxisomal ATPase PEX1 n=1 Tax=Cristinia sonorae TaxID=1940300 RepID=A0A8K0XSH6_9AGAR|nr:AAA-domain-containing protein [Cristinia sonorae]
MPRRARVHYVSLRSSLVNLPISIYGPLLERGVRPQGLAVHLVLVSQGQEKSHSNSPSSKCEAYVGWTGMASASSLAQFNSGNVGEKGLETIEIDPQFAEGLGFSQGSVVEIGLLYDLGYATTVATEPLTSDDWEIIELHASHVESTLLSQVRVAMVGQEIDIWVLGRTRVRLRVVSLEPSNGKALLLTTSTEVSIAPKVRPSGKILPTATASKTHPPANGTRETEAQNTREKRPAKPMRILRVVPLRVLPRVTVTCSALESGAFTAVGFVSKNVLQSIALESKSHEEARQIRNWKATIRCLPAPTDPTQAQGNNTPTAAPAIPKILIPTDPSTSKATGAPAVPTDEVLLTWSPEVPVPNGLIALHGAIAAVEDWDLIKPSDSFPARASHDLAGVEAILETCIDFCLSTFAVQASGKQAQGVPGLLVTGRSGSGKTSILKAVAKRLQESPRIFAYILHVDLAKYADLPIAKIKLLFKYWFEKAQWHRPTVITMDNMDKLMSPELEHAESFRNRHITELFVHYYGTAVRSAQPNCRGIVLIASAVSRASLHPTLNACHTFQETVHLKPPGKDARKEIITQVLRNHMDSAGLAQDPEAPLNLTALAMETEGYSAMDLKDLVTRAVHQAAIRATEHEHEETYEPQITHDDFVKAQADFVPLSLRDVKLHKSDTTWSDIGGLQETKRILRETLEWPTKYGPIFSQSPLRLRQGLLLYGFPGCGKTLLASAVAKECGLNFITVKGPELLNKYIGASEQSVRELFERASSAKPCVLFFDEFDSIAPKRGHDSTGVTDRVVNQMLTQLDGVEGLDGVYVLAATSRPDLIDSALLRPGRLDKSLLCNMPDIDERKEILEAVSRKLSLSPSVDFNVIAQETEGYSGADLQALLYNAHLDVIHETLAHVTEGPALTTNDRDVGPIQYTEIGGPPAAEKVLSKADKDAFERRLRRIVVNSRKTPISSDTAQRMIIPTEKPVITWEHLRKVLKTTRPSVPEAERARLDRIYRAFVSDRSGEQPVPPEAGGVGHRVTLM